MRWRRVRWKRNLRKISKGILEKVRSFKTDSCVAACVVKIAPEEIKAGTFAHLGIHWAKNGLKLHPRQIPLPKMGRYSWMNARGSVLIRKDLGLEERSVTYETPNYGDWSKGSHPMEFYYKAYPREFVGPKLSEIVVEQLGQDVRTQAYLFKFTVDEVLDRRKRKFKKDLFAVLNILQENTGNHDVFQSTATFEDYLKTLYVSWEILPPGEREDNLRKILSNIRSDDPKAREKIRERYDFLASLRPMDFVRGTNGFRAYFGARFADDLVVFENVDYGNAIYVMFEDWQELSKKTRIELLSGPEYKFVRIPHIEAWKSKLRNVIQDARDANRKK